MQREQKFFLCKHCGNLIGFLDNAGVQVICCGEAMTELKPNTVDASAEKHVPVVTQTGDTVEVAVGSVPHPSTEEHHITWVYLLTEQGGQRKNLMIGKEPKAVFALAGGDVVLGAFAYCNLHGLWKSSV